MFEFHIEKDHLAKETHIYVFQKVHNNESFITIEKGCLKSNPFVQGETSATPLLVMQSNVAKEFLTELSNTLNGQNFETNEDIKIKGTLDATRDHLEHCKKIIKVMVLKEK